MWVDYEVEDWDKLFLDAFSGFFDGQYGPDRPFCPACEVTKDWAMYIDADPMFSDELVGEAMTELYRPCAEHRDMVDVLIVREIAGHDWRWTGTSWTPSELTSLGESEGATDLPGDEPAQVAGPPTAAAVPVQKPHSYRARLVGKTSGRPEYVAQSMGVFGSNDQQAMNFVASSWGSYISLHDFQVTDGDRIVRAWAYADSPSIFDSCTVFEAASAVSRFIRYRAPSEPAAPQEMGKGAQPPEGTS
jgi:hypothetical protein